MWDYALSTYKEEVRNISVRNIRCKYYVDFDFKYSVPQHTYTISECTHYPRYLISKFDCIQTELTRLFGRKKGSDKDDDGTEGRKGRRQSNLPRQYIKPVEELVQQNPTAEALKAALNLPANQTEHDKAIKTKVL